MSIRFQTLQIGQDHVPIHYFSVTPKFSWKEHLITLSNRAFNTRANRSTKLSFFSAFLTSTRVNVDCMFVDGGDLSCGSTMVVVSKFCPKNYEPFFT